MGEVSSAVEAPDSVLVYVGWDPVGDGLLKLPFLQALRNAYPAAHITWLAGKGKSVFAHGLAPLAQGLIDEVVEDANLGERWTELLAHPLRGTVLEGRRFDLIIDTQRRVGTTLLVRRIPHQTFVSGAADFALSDLRPPVKRPKPPSLMRRLLDLIEIASGQPADTSGEFPRDPLRDRLATRLLPEGNSYIGLAPGAGAMRKCWPLEHYLDLAKGQLVRGRVPVFFLGPEEADWTSRLVRELPPALLPLQAPALAQHGPSPLVTIALARRLAAAVANDAGIGHMVAAAGCPLVSLFGPSSPERFAPIARHARVLQAQSFGNDEDMSLIPIAAAEEAIEAVLDESGHEEQAAQRDRLGEAPFRLVRPDVERRRFGGEAR